MKPAHQPEGSSKFTGSLRHYHRSDTRAARSWDDWVNGTPVKSKPSKNWPKIISSSAGVLALGGIITGLIVELG
jgi:hypothetical protein